MSEGDGNGQGNTGAGDGGQQTSFLDGIQGADLKENESLSGFENLDGLAQSYVDLKASQPVLPENVDGYKYEIPSEHAFHEENNPNGIKFGDEGSNKFKDLSLEIGLQPDQYSKIMGFMTDSIIDGNKTFAESQNKVGEETISRRKESLGSGYDAAVENSLKAMVAFEVEGLKDDPISNNDQFFGMMSKLGAAISEGKLNAGGDGLFSSKENLGEDGKKMLSFPSMDGKK